jgi:hypothetical protein
MENYGLIYKKIPKIMGLVGVIKKGRKNLQQSYQFRGIDDMYNALNEHLSNERVFVTSKILTVEREERESKSGGALIYSILTMRFRFYAEDGSYVTSSTIGEAMDSGDKSMNKAMSTAYKYALMQIFCIPTEEQKDTEYKGHEVRPVERAASTLERAASMPSGDVPSSRQKNALGAIELHKKVRIRHGLTKAEASEIIGLSKDGKDIPEKYLLNGVH